MGRMKPSARAASRAGKLGSGARFKAVEEHAEAEGARDPAAVAAAVGIKKYGKARMAKMAAAGRRKKG